VRKNITDSGWKLTDELRAWARFRHPGVNVDEQLEIFTDYWKGCGKPMADWDATFRNWIRRAPEFDRRNRNARSVAAVEMPYVGGVRSHAPPVLIRDHPLFKGVKKS
jgi:hypothetical protein